VSGTALTLPEWAQPRGMEITQNIAALAGATPFDQRERTA